MATENWDDKLIALGGPFLQSVEWASFQKSLGRETIQAESENWMWQAVIRQSNGLKYLMCSYGPVAKDADAAADALESLVHAGREHNCDFVRVEPQINHLVNKFPGARQISEVQPAHTQVIDLSLSTDELRKSLASGHRNLINGTDRRGVIVNQSVTYEDFEQFLAMLDDTAKRAGVTFFPRWYYEGLWKVLQPDGVAKLYLAKQNSEPVSAALFYDWRGTRIYAHAGAFQDLNRQANASVSLVWQAILDAKTAGFKKFDLWGIAPTDNANHQWAGITKFKKGFGGQQVDYGGTWDIPIKSWKYALYSLYRKLKGRD